MAVVVGELGRHLVKVAHRAAIHQHVVFEAEGQQHGFLDPLMRDPLAFYFFRDAQRAAVEFAEYMRNGIADTRRSGAGTQVGAVFPRLFDDLLNFVHGGFFQRD